MRITWVTRSFLDYRIPVYKALDDLCGHNLTVIYNGDVVPQRCQDKLSRVLADRSIPLTGEKRLTGVARDNASMANKGIRIPLQKGLIKEIKKSRPDILVSDGFFQWTYAPILLRMLDRHVKHVMCYERTPHTERNAGRLRTVYRKIVSRWIDAIDCNGSLTARYVSGTLGYKKNLAYGHMTADVAGVSDRVEKTTEEEVRIIKDMYDSPGLTFLYLGQLIPRKGIMQLLNAWKEADLENATLLLVGEGKQRCEIERFLKNNDISNVRLTGAVNYDDLGPYYKVADCFIIPTLEDNWSLVVPEAMAAGLPVACSVYNGCHPELVRPENGWTFDPLDIDNTVAILREISGKRDSLKSMGQESLRIVADHTPDRAARALYDVCKKLMTDNEK